MDAADVYVVSSRDGRGGLVVRVGIPLADVYLEFLGGRCRPNTVLAAAYDLKVFFAVVARPPDQVRPADVLGFITAQRTGRGGDRALQPAGLADEPGGVSAATVRRRLSIVSGFFAFLQARGDVTANPVPRGLPTRRERSRPGQGVPLVRAARRLPRILSPAQVDALTAALRTHRDQAMVAAMVLGGLRRCEVLGLRPGDLRVAERRVFVAEGKGGRQRLIPVSGRFFAAVAAYLDAERPPGAGTDRVFVVLKGPRRGQPLSARGMEEILTTARRRAGLDHATCHELRHTCLTRLKGRGVASDATFRAGREEAVAGAAALPGGRRAGGRAAGHAVDQGLLAPGCAG
jgi:integrase/recombinase XerD